MSSSAGPKRLGKYELREKLGQGGVAEVWKAFDTELHRYVAIKLLHADLRTDPDFVTRFSREARYIAALHHPNIVRIYDFQAGRNGTLSLQSPEMEAPIAYMVMDYVEGGTLAQYLHSTSRAGKFPAPTDIVHLFTSISKAVDYAHQQGMIHRDIKPANILLDKRHTAPNSIGEPVLTDFGIAKIVGAGSDTISGMVLGTPFYISPEQAQGYPASGRSDIYALGVILYEMCTGVYPFQSESVTAIMMQHITLEPRSPALINPAIPPALTAVILRAIAKDPRERFSSASALTAAVAEAFHLPVPADLFLPTHPSTDMQEPTYRVSRQSGLSSSIAPQEAQRSLPATVTEKPSQPSPVSTVKSPPTPTSPPPAQSRRARKGNLIAWLVLLLVLASSIIVSINVLGVGRASPTVPTTVGTLTFTDSEQYDPYITVGYNDIVTLSLHSLTTPQTDKAYFAWLMPDQGTDNAVPLLLGHLSVNGGNATLEYASPGHTNLLAQYSRVRITEQPANHDPSTPSPDARWEGSLPSTPNPGDPNNYSLLSHLRHLLAKDPVLEANKISGGLAIWTNRNVAKVEEWSSAAQGGWRAQMSDGNADLIHKHMLRILDYLDGQTYVGLDAPAGSSWLVDPLAGKFGLLSYTQAQEPPGYLPHVDTHVSGLAESVGHTDEQQKIAIQVHEVVTHMIDDLAQVHKDAAQLVKLSSAQLRQTDTLTLLNEMAKLTTEVKSGWFDAKTGQNVGGVIWLSARLHQLAKISLQASSN